MYFSRATLDADQIGTAQLSRLLAGDQYASHKLLWQLFSTGRGADRDQSRPFIFRQVEDAPLPTFYLVSDKPPAEGHPNWRIDTKNYNPALSPGQMLHFDVRVNPVKRAKQPDGRHKRHDVVNNARRQQKESEQTDIDRRALEHQAGFEWLNHRAETLGFGLDEDHFFVCGYQQHRIHKKGQKHPIRFSSLDLSGLLEVRDVQAFEHTLLHGIGPSKGFGCGLLLIRPV